jgi:hypothetical protein
VSNTLLNNVTVDNQTDNPPMTRNCIWMEVFSQVVTMSLLRVVVELVRRLPPCDRHVGLAALVSASGQCE